MRIYQKLLLGFISIALLVVFVGIISLTTNDKVSGDIRQLIESSIDEVEGAAEMSFSLQASHLGTQKLLTEKYRILMVPDEAESAVKAAEKANAIIDRAIEEFEIWLAKSRHATHRGVELASDPEQKMDEKDELKTLDNIEQIFIQYKKTLLHFTALTETNLNEANQWMKNTLDPLYHKALASVRVYEENAEGELTNEGMEIEEATATANQIVLSTTAVSLLAAIILGLTISRLISTPLAQLSSAALQIGSGQLETRLDIQTKDEVGDLARSFNKMVHDIQAANTELVATQTQLVQSAKLASVGEMATGVAHELNQPLGIISMNAELRLSEVQNNNYDKIEASYQLILQQVERATVIINHLRIFGRESGTLSRSANDINKIIKDSFIMINEQLRLNDVEVLMELADNLPPIHCNSIQIEQVLTNLIANAKDALKTATLKKITLRSRQLDNEILLEIEDTGAGILDSDIKKIFDPFFTTKEIGEGTGLGLSISYGIIEDHGWHLTVRSKPGEGAVFQIKIPVVVS